MSKIDSRVTRSKTFATRMETSQATTSSNLPTLDDSFMPTYKPPPKSPEPITAAEKPQAENPSEILNTPRQSSRTTQRKVSYSATKTPDPKKRQQYLNMVARETPEQRVERLAKNAAYKRARRLKAKPPTGPQFDPTTQQPTTAQKAASRRLFSPDSSPEYIVVDSLSPKPQNDLATKLKALTAEFHATEQELFPNVDQQYKEKVHQLLDTITKLANDSPTATSPPPSTVPDMFAHLCKEIQSVGSAVTELGKLTDTKLTQLGNSAAAQLKAVDNNTRLTHTTLTQSLQGPISYAKAVTKNAAAPQTQPLIRKKHPKTYKVFVKAAHQNGPSPRSIHSTLTTSGDLVQDVFDIEATRFGCVVHFELQEAAASFAQSIQNDPSLGTSLQIKQHYLRRPTILVHDVPRRFLNKDTKRRSRELSEAIRTHTDYLTHLDESEITYVREYGRANYRYTKIILGLSPRAYQLIEKHGFMIEMSERLTHQVEKKLIVTQCQKCFRFGHKSADCRGKQVCVTCGDDHELISGRRCRELQKCRNCYASHRPNSEECPVYKKHMEIAEENTDYENRQTMSTRRQEPEPTKTTTGQPLLSQVLSHIDTQNGSELIPSASQPLTTTIVPADSQSPGAKEAAQQHIDSFLADARRKATPTKSPSDDQSTADRPLRERAVAAEKAFKASIQLPLTNISASASNQNVDEAHTATSEQPITASPTNENTTKNASTDQ